MVRRVRLDAVDAGDLPAGRSPPPRALAPIPVPLRKDIHPKARPRPNLQHDPANALMRRRVEHAAPRDAPVEQRQHGGPEEVAGRGPHGGPELREPGGAEAGRAAQGGGEAAEVADGLRDVACREGEEGPGVEEGPEGC